MSINDVSDWSPWYAYLDPSSPRKPDVVLNVREKVTRNDGTVQVFMSQLRELIKWQEVFCFFSTQVSDYFMDGHRVLLAAANPVFRSLFYGPEAVKGDTVVIEVVLQSVKSLLFQNRTSKNHATL